jgi:hypothetical protein
MGMRKLLLTTAAVAAAIAGFFGEIFSNKIGDTHIL